ncbi:hypothetical protein DL98DRAFT_658814 [Cadophora sp. DSE1049]|nr:hypothetical protein DL98DRAFT_658814 [Cadophora sp. DSE1049]
MYALPLDLLRSIIQHIPKRDLPALRLACHSLDRPAAESLYCNTTVWIQRQSLERLLNIAHSGVGRHVKRLTLGFELLPRELPKPESYLSWLYHQHCREFPSDPPPPPYPVLTFANIGDLTGRTDWTEDRMLEAYGQYGRMIEEQQFMEVTGMDVVSLAASLSRLDNLHSIVIKADYYNEGRSLADFPRDISLLLEKALLIPYYNRHIRKDQGRRHLRNIIRATAAATVKVTELAISDSDNIMATRVLSLRPEDLKIADFAFQHVKKFYFKLPDFTANASDEKIFAGGQLAQLIQAMGCLEELTLVSSSYNPYVPWEAICGTKRLASLRVLDLQSFDFQEQEFMEFLLRHKTTLRVLKLFCAEMYSGTFSSLLSRMRENLDLVSLELTGVLEDIEGNFLDYSYVAAKALEDYVTKRRHQFPLDIVRLHQRGNSEEI